MSNTFVSNDLVEQAELRNKLIDRIDVLSKVKELFLIPKLEMMSIGQVAEFYNVPTDVINKTFQRNKNEITTDGVQMLTIQKIRSLCLGQDVQDTKNIVFTPTNGGSTIVSFDNQTIALSNAKAKYFSPRAVLRIGMLLRDSEVAKEVRTQLLNTFETTTEEQKVSSIDEEAQLLINVIRAEDAGDMAVNLKYYRDYMLRHISALEEEKARLEEERNNLNITNTTLMGVNVGLKAENAGLQNANAELNTEIEVAYNKFSEWSPRVIVGKLIASIGSRMGGRPEFAWGKLRSNLYHNQHINLAARRGDSNKSYISFVKDDEWDKVMAEVYVLAKDYDVDIAKAVGATNARVMGVCAAVN